MPWADNVSKVVDFIGELCVLFQVLGNLGFAGAVQNRVDVFDVLLRVFGEDDDIISVDEAYLPLSAREDNIQSTLEGCRCACQAERH